MIRYILFLISILSVLPCFSQKSMEVIYKYEPKFMVEQSDSKFYNDIITSTEKSLPHFPFTLIFNDKNSEFKVETGMSIDNSNEVLFKLMLLMADVEGTIFNNLSENITTIQKDYFRELRRFEENFDKHKWQILNDEKVILGYRCVKATTKIEAKTSKGIKHREVVAWFTKELPFPFGPTIFRGLPGLILEVHYDWDLGYILKAEKIENKKNYEVQKPDKSVKVITQDEIDKGVKNSRSFFER